MLRIDLHCHTKYSYDSEIEPEALVNECKKRGIDKLAITDHNTIEGALMLKKRAPHLIIIGEEIRSTHGDIIGLFLSEYVPPYLSAKETIRLIRAQNGLVYIPHPFDQFRAGVGKKVLDENKKNIDIIEIFNSKTLIPAFDAKALCYAKQHNMVMAAGSDTHQLFSLGNAYNQVEDFSTPEQLVKNLTNAKRHQKRTGFGVYVHSGITMIKSAFTKKT